MAYIIPIISAVIGSVNALPSREIDPEMQEERRERHNQPSIRGLPE